MDDRELLGTITDEEHAALGYHTGELASEREKALEYYLQFPLGNEVEGESEVVDSSVRDTVEWMLPSLIRVFAASGRIVEFEPVGAEDVQAADEASDAVNHVFWKQNNGFLVLYEWFKDALISKNGVVKFYYDEQITRRKEKYQGLTDEQMAMLVADDNVEVIAHTAEIDGEVVLHDVELVTTSDRGKVCVESIPPEEFLITARHNSISLDGCEFCEHRSRKTVSDLLEMGFKQEDLDEIGSDEDFAEISGEYLARRLFTEEQFPDDERDGPSRPVWVREVYIKTDWDDDGIAELRRVIVAGNKILDNEEVDYIPFAAITPNIMPHRYTGISVAEEVMDLQEIKSVLWRQILNNLYLSNHPRKAVLATQGGMVHANLDDLLSSRVGGIVREYQPGAVRDIETRFVAGAAYPMLEYIDQQRMNRTGVNQLSSGLDADAINKTARGAMLADNKSAEKVELVARIFAETGVKALMKGILRELNKYQLRPMMLRMHGKFTPVDPRNWNTGWDVTVNVGLGTGNKDQQLGHIMNIGNAQKELIAAGKQHMVNDSNLYATVKKIVENAGYKHVEEFITDPRTVQPPPPPPNPDMIKEQGEMQRTQMKLQADAQKTSANGDLAMAQAEISAQTQLKAVTIQSQTQIAIEQMRIAAQERLEQQKMDAEAEFKVFDAENQEKAKEADMNDKKEERKKKYDEPQEKEDARTEAVQSAIEAVQKASEEASSQLAAEIEKIQKNMEKQIQSVVKSVSDVSKKVKEKPKKVKITSPSGKTYEADVE